MPIINELTKEIIFKVVYYGPACAGKYQNFEWINKVQNRNLTGYNYYDEPSFRVDCMVKNFIEETGCIIYCNTISILNVKWLENYKIKFHLETISRVLFYMHEWKKLLVNKGYSDL